MSEVVSAHRKLEPSISKFIIRIKYRIMFHLPPYSSELKMKGQESIP